MADYRKYANDIERAEFKNFYPISKQHLNEPNKRTEFNIDFGDSFCSSKFQFYISGSLTKQDGQAYLGTDNVKLIDNFVPFLFSKTEVRKHNKMIEEIENCGQLSTMKGTISYSKSDVFSNSFESTFKFGQFEAVGDLAHFGLGFFENVNFPIYKGGFYISFIRAEDDDAILKITGNSVDGKITINEFFIRVPIIDYKTTSKIRLIDEITKSQNIMFNFLDWQCIEQKGISGTTYSLDITNIYRNISNPKFVIIGFQTDRQNNQEKDPSKFDSLNVKNIRVKLNGSYYPDELQNLNISGGLFRIMYQMYQDFKKVYYNNTNMYYNPKEFLNNRPIFVIDTTRSLSNISASKNDIIVNIDFQNAVTNSVCYVIVVSEKFLSYDVIKNDIREIQ
uniref:Double jelly roll-like domain-containing protein n=1 Tax=Cuerna arida TaxID=1464854 RepID=A0A1B6EXB8_9HEMI